MDINAPVTKGFLAARFAEQSVQLDSNHRIFVWTQAIIMAAVILPYPECLLALT